MGYYTSYSIEFEPEIGFEEQEEQFKTKLLEVAKENYCEQEVEELLEYGINAKLYDIDKWIGTIAPEFPNLLIILDGDGECSDDLWEMRWKGNEHEYQEAVIPPFKNPALITNKEKTQNK